MTLPGPISFRTVTVRVPESGEARIPKGYAHEFASVPLAWRTVRTNSRYIDFPALDPASERAMLEGFAEPERTCPYCGMPKGPECPDDPSEERTDG